MGIFNSGYDAAGKVHMVVLEQNHVKQTDAVVATATDLDGFFLEHAHAGSSLSGVENTGVSAL